VLCGTPTSWASWPALGPPGVASFWTIPALNRLLYGTGSVSLAPISVRRTIWGPQAGRQRLPLRFATLTSGGAAPTPTPPHTTTILTQGESAIRQIRRDFRGDAALLKQVTETFKELKAAHETAVDRIGSMELERERLTQLAGVGLMIEVIAHELTRTTESTQSTLKAIDRSAIDLESDAAFRVLEQQMKIIHRRLRILEPLTIPSRQRRVQRDLGEIVAYVLESHTAQFERHGISLDDPGRADEPVIAFLIEGHVVQIIENLIVNSVYWLDLQRKVHPKLEPKISIRILDNPPRMRLTDNGPGIPASRAQVVFEPFFSTKPSAPNRRSGIGLFIARQNAELLGGTLELVDEGAEHVGHCNTFELELRREAK